MTVELIEKECLNQLKFPKFYPELSLDKKILLLEKLKKALVIGNTDKVKCSIVFNDSDGLKQINTTIWEYDDEFISLKSGMTLNLKFIEDIIL